MAHIALYLIFVYTVKVLLDLCSKKVEVNLNGLGISHQMKLLHFIFITFYLYGFDRFLLLYL